LLAEKRFPRRDVKGLVRLAENVTRVRAFASARDKPTWTQTVLPFVSTTETGY
jgi:hypothetical protein